MFHICFAADENYIKYTAVLITSIVKSTDTSREFKDFFDGGSGANARALATRERERERESKNGADTRNLAKQILNSQNSNSINSAQNSQNSVNLMPNSAENSQISQNLSQNSQNYNFANSNFTHFQTAGTRTGALTDTQNLANSQRQNAQTAQNSTNQNENSQISVNLATQIAQNPTNTPKNSLESYKKLDYNSLSDEEKSEGYVFHILTDKISENTRQKLEKLAQNLSEIYPCEILVHICDDTIFQGLPKWCGNYSAYYRLFIPNFMPQNLKMCLYLDVDMLVVQDLRELFALDLDDKILGVVADSLKFSAFGLFAKNLQTPDIYFDNFYFNSGFLLINLIEWRNQNVTQKCLRYMADYFVIWPDQDALNGVCKTKQVIILPIQYNLFILLYPKNSNKAEFYHHKSKWQHYSQKEINLALSNPAIFHYGGVEKPWQFSCNFIDLNGKIIDLFWWKIAFETPFFADELRGILADLQAGRGGGESEFERLKRLEHFGGFVRFYTRKQLAKIRRFFAKIRRKTRFIRYPIKRFFGFGGERV